jgi:hypothetical protein
MKTKRMKAIAIVAVLALVFASPARAILGLGDVVFDPSNYAQAIKTFIQLQQQYAQLIQIYQQTRQQYEQLLWMGKFLPASVKARYRAMVTPWTHPTGTNTYGKTAGWMNAINAGTGIQDGYAEATEKLDTYGSALGNIPSDQLDRIKTSYGTVELTDGANLAGIETIGRIRGNTFGVERAIQALEDDSLSADPALNTETAVLNKINAANLIGLRSAEDTNQLLASLAESQILAAKRTRDAEAQAIHQHVRFMAEGRAALAAQAADASQAMLAWRMP